MANWNKYLANYQLQRGGYFFGAREDECDSHLVLTEGEPSPILVWVDTDPAGKYSTKSIFARTCVQLNGRYTLTVGDANAVIGGVKGIAGMLGGGNDYGFPEVTRNRSIATNNEPFTKLMLGDLDLRNSLRKRKRDRLRVQPSPQGDGWHVVEVGDVGFEGMIPGTSPWMGEEIIQDQNASYYMDPQEKAVLKQAAQDHFNEQLDEFLALLRAARRAVTTWRL